MELFIPGIHRKHDKRVGSVFGLRLKNTAFHVHVRERDLTWLVMNPSLLMRRYPWCSFEWERIGTGDRMVTQKQVTVSNTVTSTAVTNRKLCCLMTRTLADPVSRYYPNRKPFPSVGDFYVRKECYKSSRKFPKTRGLSRTGTLRIFLFSGLTFRFMVL